MKHTLKTIVFLGAALTSSFAIAEWNNALCNSIGADYKWINIKGCGEFAPLFPKSSSGASIYYGSRFNENFGIELGYDWSPKKKYTFTTTAQATRFVTSFFTGGPVAVSETITRTVNTDVRFSQLRLDFNGYIPIACEGLELLGSVGIGFASCHLNQNIVTINSGGTGNSGVSTITTFSTSSSRNISNSVTKTIWRLGAGVQYLITCNVGIRGMFRYEGLSGFKIENINRPGTSSGFKNATAFTIGLFYKF